MKLSSHADRTEKLVGIRAEDIHSWIDGFFDAEGFERFVQGGNRSDFNPYNHRKYRHCAEALEGAYKEFEGTYTREQIKAVFEQHIRDDYDGFIPLQEDFDSAAFAERYHESNKPEDLEKILSEAELAEYFKGKAYPHGKASHRKLSAGFYWRIVWPAVIAAILFASSAFTIIVPVFRNSMMKQKKEMIKELTYTAASAIEFHIHQEQSGVMSREEAQRLAAAEVAELRYGEEGKDYFWITDMHPRMIMHPYRTELVNRDLTDYTDREDKSGKKLFVEFVKLVKAEGEGYLEYLWQWKDDASRAEPKLSFVQGVPEWGWVIGTGVYIHDVEAEISRLSRNLMIADGVIAAILLALMANSVLQSRRIELDRQQAEAGLREAKDRYRALVEGSSEGYVLEIDGETVYSNHTLRQMTGYDEAELAAMKIWELLVPECECNEFAEDHLKQIYAHTAASAEFEARIVTKRGDPLDVEISTSRIFFSEKNGHTVSIREISRGRQHTLNAFYRTDALQSLPDLDLLQQITACGTTGQVIQTIKQLPEQVRLMSEQGVRPGLLRSAIGRTYDAAIKQFIKLYLNDSNDMPVPFAFLSLGSNARHEMTMFSDQDNALVFEDVEPDRLSDARLAFLKLADDVCGKLNKAGYPYCPGGIMAANPKWCLSVSEWKKHFSKWILEATPQSILEVNVFFDLRCAYGEEGFVHELREHVQDLSSQNPQFFIHFARNCLGYKVPLGLFGRIRTEKRDGGKIINVKECIKPIETFARIYALKHEVSATGTLERLEQLRDAGLLQGDTYREMAYVFDYLWRLRFYNQIETNIELSSDTDALDIEKLTPVERDNLQAVLSSIPVFQSKLSYDFLGVSTL